MSGEIMPPSPEAPTDPILCYVLADADGEIRQRGTCEASAFASISGAVACESTGVSTRTHYVAQGAVRAYTDQQRADKAAPHAPWQTWSNQAMAWIDPRTLADIKRDKLPELKAAALAASEADITVQGVTFAADAATRAELAQELALAQAEGAGYSCDWQRADGTAITLTGAQVKGLMRQISNRRAAIRAQYRARHAQVMAAASKAEVNAVTW